MSEQSSSPREAAKRVWAQFRLAERGPNGATVAASKAQAALKLELQRWIGVDGYVALYGRAQSLALAEHRGTKARADVEATTLTLLTHIVDLLARVIGAEIAIRMVDGVAANGPREDTAGTSNGERDG